MLLRVFHETHYQYETPVVLSQQLLHLTPRTLETQQVRAHGIHIAPQPGELAAREDYFGNPVSHLLLAAPHTSLAVHAESTVETSPRAARYENLPGAPWNDMRAQFTLPAGEALLEATQFLYESPHVETSRELGAYASASFPKGRGVLQGARDLVQRIHADFDFDSTATSVSTPLREVLKSRRGVCQDFAHLMIGCLRTLGLPARYVSGYILTTPPPGRPRLVGADASHAWVSVYCPLNGWVDMDPTNDCLVDDEHVTLAWGRDFSDVTPMRGVILGGGEQTLQVRVTVAPVE